MLVKPTQLKVPLSRLDSTNKEGERNSGRGDLTRGRGAHGSSRGRGAGVRSLRDITNASLDKIDIDTHEATYAAEWPCLQPNIKKVASVEFGEHVKQHPPDLSCLSTGGENSRCPKY